ncbi:MAG: VanZ family protein [Firmicutes bacterium]|nr:VanZ family protein [Bacillota bacterium]
MIPGNRLTKLWQILSLWGLVVAQMSLIFYFSSRPAGSIVLEEFPVSAPLGHLFGYFLLSVFLYRAFNRGSFDWNSKAAGSALLVGFLYALSDEIHQLFVPGRQAAIIDVVLDTVGLLIFLILIRIRTIIKR